MLSLTSIANITLFSSLMILLMQIVLKKNEFLTKTGLSILSAVIYITAVRSLFPVELPFMKNINVTKIWPPIYIFLLDTKITLSEYTVNLSSILVSIWAAGIVMLIFRELFSYRKLRKFLKNCTLQHNTEQTSFTNRRILQHESSHKTAMILKRPARHFACRLYVTDRNVSPIIFGFWHPCIILPQGCLENGSWRYVLEHEIAHYFHGDLYFNLLCGLLRIIYWWNPFIYLLKRQHSLLLELNIDAIVTKSMNKEQKIEYLESLLEIKKSCTLGQMESFSSTSFLTDSPSAFSHRFKLIYENLEGQKKAFQRSFFPLLLSFAFILFCSFCFIIEPIGIRPEDEAISVELTPENAYFIDNLDGTYDIYYNHCCFGTVTQIFDETLNVYPKNMEIPAYETNH